MSSIKKELMQSVISLYAADLILMVLFQGFLLVKEPLFIL